MSVTLALAGEEEEPEAAGRRPRARKRLAPRAFVEDLGRISIKVGERASRRDRHSQEGALIAGLPAYSAADDGHAGAGDRRALARDGTRSRRQLAQSDRLLPASAVRAQDGRRFDRRLPQLQGRSDVARRGPSPQPKLRLPRVDRGHQARSRARSWWAELAESYTGRLRGRLHLRRLGLGLPRHDTRRLPGSRSRRSIALDIRAGFFDRAISVAQLALAADPEAEQIELKLLKLYRLTGAHAAAAEQYAHYAAVMREQLGVEPPPLESI